MPIAQVCRLMIHLKTAKLARWQIHSLCWSGGLLWVTGAAWLWLHYFGQVKGEFGPETSPFEPWMMRIHGAAMIVALLGSGSLLVVHIWRGWTYRSQRWLRGLLGGLIIVLILTGYCLYYVGDEKTRAGASLVHWMLGLAALPVFVLHYRRGRRLRRS